MNTIKIIALILLVAFGGFMIAYGGWDDSPGGQLLGLIAVIGGGVGILREHKRSS
jgi:hypothetical protein